MPGFQLAPPGCIMCTTTTIFDLEFIGVRVEDLFAGVLSHTQGFDCSDFAFEPTSVEILLRDEDANSVETFTTGALRVEVTGQDPWKKIGALTTHVKAAEYLRDVFGDNGITPKRIHHVATIESHVTGERA